MNPANPESVIIEVLVSIHKEVRTLRQDHKTAATEHDDFAGGLNATMDNLAESIAVVVSRVEDLGRSHAALCRRVDRLQGCR